MVIKKHLYYLEKHCMRVKLIRLLRKSFLATEINLKIKTIHKHDDVE